MVLTVPRENYAVFNYWSKKKSDSLVIDFKNGDANAISIVQDLFVDEITSKLEYWKNESRIKCIFTAPASKKTLVGTNIKPTPIEQVAEKLDQTFDWLHWVKRGLIRTETIPSSARSRIRGEDRPDWTQHHGTIECVRTDTYRIYGGNIMLIDDVFTTGATSNACSDILSRKYKHIKVFGLFLAKVE
jgi:predicted amidophosphoribosyltransferase